MINQGIDVPDKTIAVFPRYQENNEFISMERISAMVKKPSKKREWFTPKFYRCLPLTIGNQYGFTIQSEFSFSALWTGGEEPESILLSADGTQEDLHSFYPKVSSHFGSGILTISPPFVLRTPPGVNLITINPPNYIIPNVTVMTGVVESDNLRRMFTFNLKLQIPHVMTHFPAGTPLAAFIPVPRYFSDEFELKDANEIFSPELIEQEHNAADEANAVRERALSNTKYGIDRDYFQGKDPYGNQFPDHQMP